jgi:hypothetical protein
MRRRDFLRAGLAGGAALGGLPVLARQAGGGSVALMTDPNDPVASSECDTPFPAVMRFT